MPEPALNFREFVTNHHPADWEVAHMYHHSPLRVREIAHQTGHSVGGLYRKLRDNGGFPNRRRPDHQTILDLDERGLSVPRIADMVGCSPANVRYVLSKKGKNGNSTE